MSTPTWVVIIYNGTRSQLRLRYRIRIIDFVIVKPPASNW